MALSKKKNIILILTDDQGYWSLGCSGNREIRTPNIDSLAATGARMENFFCVSPVCSPARASLLTGRIPSQHGVHDWLRNGNGEAERHGDVPIEYLQGITGYTEMLKENGYTCGISGKWHLGATGYPQKGYDHWFVTLGGSGTYHDAKCYSGTELIQTHGYLTDVITNDALAFIEKCCEEDRPFYLNLTYTAPHSPHVDQHRQEYVDYYLEHCTFVDVPQHKRSPWSIDKPHDIEYSLTFASPERKYLTIRDLLAGYYAAVQGVDDGVGRVLQKLKEKGIREDTLVIFTSDNGFSCGQHGIWGKGNGTFPLNLFDTAVKVPCIFNMPGTIEGGKVYDALLSGYDFMPTLLEFAGIDNPEAEKLPGRSFLPLLYGEAGNSEYHESITVMDEYGPARMIRTKEWKYIHRYPYGPHELYDLVHDPEEQFNLLEENRYFYYGPEEIEERTRQMRAMLERWFSAYVDPDLDGAREPVCGRGQLCRVGSAAEGRMTFSPVSQKEYGR